MNLLTRLKGGRDEVRHIETIDDYAALYNQFTFNGIGYGYGMGGSLPIIQTWSGQQTELAPNTFVGLSSHAYQSNGVVFACMMVRQLLFSAIRFRWERIVDGKPSDTFGSASLGLLDRPWVGGTTQDLLAKIIQYVDLAGNAYIVREQDELVCLRPDWVDIVVEPMMRQDGSGQIGWRKVGYIYTVGGRSSDQESVGLLADEVAHFAPYPDPLAIHRGMSWLTPILREIQADQAMTHHQRKFFEHAATPNMVVKHADNADPAAAQRWAEQMQEKFGGVQNAYKTLNLYPGADVTVVGANLKDISFKEVRGGGETRIAAAAGVPPVIVGLSEGLEAATYSNYGQARRRLADGTAHPLWQNISGSMERIIEKPKGAPARLWYDATNVPFLREDEKDAALIAQVEASTMNTLITAGFKKESVIKAVIAGDWRLLEDSGFTSVQLFKPGEGPGANSEEVSSEDGMTDKQRAWAEAFPATNGKPK